MMMQLLVALAVASAQDDAERLKRLEEQVKKQQAEIDELKKSEWGMTFTDGLHFRTRDGAFDFRAGGRFIEHYRHVFDRPDASRTSPDTFFVREAFLDLEATLDREWLVRVVGDFTSSAGGPVANLENAYFEWKRYREFVVRLGQFKGPNSQETMTSTLFPDAIERSIVTRFVTNFELGAEVYGHVADGLLSYYVAVMNGRAEPSSSGRSTNDNNDEKELLARVTTMPFVAEPEFFLRQLRLGAYGSWTGMDEVPMATQFDVATTELAVTFLDSTAGLLDGRRWRAGVELSYVIGPASVRGEYLWRKDEVRDAADTVEERLFTRAWYGQVTCILFGAEKGVETRLTPAQPFDLSEGHWGAFEVVYRVAGASVGSEEFVAVGNSMAGQSNRVVIFTGGFNWYPAKNVRFSANVIHEDYRNDIDFGNGVTKDRLAGLLFRFQIDF